MSRDWSRFHRHYDNPESSFTRRLEVTQELLDMVLDRAAPGPISLFDLCAGEGRVVLPVVAGHARGPDVHAVLVDSSAKMCETARATAAELRLTGVDVVNADAGRSSTYVPLPRADVVVLSGVFRYLGRRDVRQTARGLRQVCASSATLIWTLGGGVRCTVDDVRRELERAGFREIAVRTHRPIHDAEGVVAVHRMEAPPEPLQPGRTWFRFLPAPLSLRARLHRLAASARRHAANVLRH
jgi:SAM-dependent methyltransferase